MSWFRRTGPPKPSSDEERLLLDAEGAQRWVCAHWGAPFEQPSADSLVTISPLVLQGHMPVAGVRYEKTRKMSGWIIYASNLHEEVDDLTYEHVVHLATMRPDLLQYMGLPVGWRFDLESEGENVRRDKEGERAMVADDVVSRDPPLALVVGVAIIVGLVTFPLFGLLGSLPAAVTAFFVMTLIGSGFRVLRAILWGVVTAGLFAAATVVPEPADYALTVGGAALFSAGVLLPSFRRRWFGRAIEEEVSNVDEPEVSDLLRDLASDDMNVVEDARYALEGRLDAVGPLLKVLPSLGSFGALSAIEVIESWPLEVARRAEDPSVGDIILPLLRDDADTVREWAANVLAWVGETKAVPEIDDALRRSKAAGIPAGWTEPVAYRRALTALGARQQVLPARAAGLARREPTVGLCWAAHDLPDVVDALASENQLVLDIQAWRPEGGQLYGERGPVYEVDLVGDWREVVVRGRDDAVRAASAWTPRDGTVVTLEWISEFDR